MFNVLYLFSCLGIITDYHYCGGELQSIAIYHVCEVRCCGEDEEKEMDCCYDTCLVVDKDESESIKTSCLGKNDGLINILAINQNPLKMIGISNSYRLSFLPFDHAPPNITAKSLFVKNRMF